MDIFLPRLTKYTPLRQFIIIVTQVTAEARLMSGRVDVCDQPFPERTRIVLDRMSVIITEYEMMTKLHIYYTNMSASTHLPRMHLPPDLLWEYRIKD